MRTLLLVLAVVLALSVTSLAFGAEGGILGFQAWKNSRVDEAKANLERLQQDLQGNEKNPAGEKTPKDAKDPKKESAPSATASREDAPRGLKPTRPDQKLEQAQVNVELANELSVQDYFVLYLNQFKTRDAFLEVAKKLSPEETAELMMSYKKQLDGNDSDSLPTPLNSTPASSPKNAPSIRR
jgi:hypothetical protein